MDPYTLSIIIFIGVLALLLFRDRSNIEVSNYVLFIRRTSRGRGLIARVANLNRKLWNYVGSFSTVVGFIGMGIAFYYIANMFLGQITGAPTTGGPRLVVPVPSQEAAFLPGVLGVPFWSWIISIGLLMVVHEGLHGIMAKAVGSEIRSLGVLLLAIIPGAFVEPDEENLKQKNWKDQLKVYSAGSFANFCLGAFVFVLVTFAFVPAFMTSAVSFQGYVDPGQYNTSTFPAQNVNLTGPILSIDGQRTEDLEDLSEILDTKNPGETVRIKTTRREYSLELAEDPREEGEAFIGIARVGNTYIPKQNYRQS
ncbi:MAG: site-2 protease family protein, partial [Candidatus Aenigmatarchaeota archaeon]